jgi:hypothetical protein
MSPVIPKVVHESSNGYTILPLLQLSAELMVAVASLKSLIAWIWTWVINDWVDRSGMLVVFMVVASINVCAYATTLIYYFHGKRIRIWIHEADMLGRAGLR